ncbi:hypothetical protein WJX84_005395 [Apatococcus fuscideae]|uniref:Ubiquitin-like domain-containing protein n=1 Tax=Apatococcus fuscideae TaxID=2026836 RepID=A0AAW1SKQ3_9CHLO
METRTDCLDDLQLDVDLDSTVELLNQELGHKLNWRPVGSLQRLEGFTDPWEKSMLKGREVLPATTLRSAGVASGDIIVVVRRELIAEAWQIVGENDEESSSDEEDGW